MLHQIHSLRPLLMSDVLAPDKPVPASTFDQVSRNVGNIFRMFDLMGSQQPFRELDTDPSVLLARTAVFDVTGQTAPKGNRTAGPSDPCLDRVTRQSHAARASQTCGPVLTTGRVQNQ